MLVKDVFGYALVQGLTRVLASLLRGSYRLRLKQLADTVLWCQVWMPIRLRLRLLRDISSTTGRGLGELEG
jgi:hypothetical protein